VIVENIHRNLQDLLKNSPKLDKDIMRNEKQKSIILAVDEVGIGLFFSTLTSVIVFMPMSQITGMMGDYMGPLSLFVPLALIFSLLVAYVLTPFLADVLMPMELDVKVAVKKKTYGKGFLQKYWGKFINFVKNINFFEWLTEVYGRFLKKILWNKKFRKFFVRGIFIILMGIMSFPVFQLVHFKMLPSANKNHFFIYIDAPEGTALDKTQKLARFIAGKVLENEQVISVQNFTGEPSVLDFNGLFKGSNFRQSATLATLRVNLVDKNNREIKSTPLINQLRAEIFSPEFFASVDLDDEFKDLITKTKVKFLEDPPGPPVRSTMMAKIKGPNREILTKISRDLEQKFYNIERIVDIDTSLETPVSKFVYKVDHEKALLSGISGQTIAETLRAVSSEYKISQFHTDNNPEFLWITMSVDKNKRDNLDDLNNIYLRNYAGQMIPLLSIVERVDRRNAPVLYLDERDETVYVTGELDNRSVVYATIDLIYDLINYDFPDNGELVAWNLFGFKYQLPNGEIYKIDFGGEWEMTLENFRDLGLAMIGAFAFIYIVLVSQFKSFRTPLLVLSTVPLAFLGILPGFALLDLISGTFLTATSLIGFIALMGIVVNNAIIYFEYFEILQAKGLELKKALLEAGKTRLRPILLTSITTILGNLTIVNDPVWSGLAWSIVFGLSLSAILTLVVFPALFVGKDK